MTYDLSLTRILRAPAARVWRALTDPAAIVKWNPPDGYVCEIEHLDLREGGSFRMAFRALETGAATAFGGRYLEVVPEARLVATDRFDDPGLPGEITTTYRLRAVAGGCELVVAQTGLPDAVPPEACRLGWQQSLDLLARLVEAEPG